MRKLLFNVIGSAGYHPASNNAEKEIGFASDDRNVQRVAGDTCAGSSDPRAISEHGMAGQMYFPP